MPKNSYEALRSYLADLETDEWVTTFAEIEKLLGFPLPASARTFNAWWSNSVKGTSGTKAWRQAGFRATKVNLMEERVVFTRGLARPLSKRALRAIARLNRPPPPDQAVFLAEVRAVYDEHGIEALHSRFLDKKRGLYSNLWKIGLRLPDIVERLGLTEEFTAWKGSGRVYRGKFVPNRTWERILAEVSAIRDAHGGRLPTMEWFRKNHHGGLVSKIFRSGHSWEEVRATIGDFETSPFRISRSGIRWRSHPEASLSDFLYARGIPHRRGERYDQSYAEASGRHHGHYDLHFTTPDGREIKVEIWGGLDKLSGGRYAKTRAAKEAFAAGDPYFLGVEYVDCLSDEKLTAILKPYIGIIDPFNFEQSYDPYIETSHWTDADDLLETCRQLAAMQPDGILPNEQWMRKRGRYADREGPIYNTLAVRINQWLGGSRKARQLLDQAEHSTENWTAEKAIAAWRKFEEMYEYTPSQIRGHKDEFPAEVIRRGQTIHGACDRYKVTNEARRGRSARKIIWTPETVAIAWADFEDRYGVPVNLCVGNSAAKYSKTQSNEAARIYNSARRLGLVNKLKGRDSEQR